MGITKQAVHQNLSRQLKFNSLFKGLVAEFEALRRMHPGCGLEKAYYTLAPEFIGRDRFIEVFKELGYMNPKKRNFKRTTYSCASKYQNLIEGYVVNRPYQVWQSDITYIYIGGKFYYAVFIVDVFSKQIVGYNVSDNMQAECNISAFKMALKKHNAPIIHHSDRGSQYISKGYIDLLQSNNVQVSMSGSVQENAYAERINRTIKEEFIDYWNINTLDRLKKKIKKAVDYYNENRIHWSLPKVSPNKYIKLWEDGQIKDIITIFELPKNDSREEGEKKDKRQYQSSNLSKSHLSQKNKNKINNINKNQKVVNVI